MASSRALACSLEQLPDRWLDLLAALPLADGVERNSRLKHEAVGFALAWFR
jgi:hypothetical protein